MKKNSQRVAAQKVYSKTAGEHERSSAGKIAAVNRPFSSASSAGLSSFAMHSLTLAYRFWPTRMRSLKQPFDFRVHMIILFQKRMR